MLITQQLTYITVQGVSKQASACWFQPNEKLLLCAQVIFDEMMMPATRHSANSLKKSLKIPQGQLEAEERQTIEQPNEKGQQDQNKDVQK